MINTLCRKMTDIINLSVETVWFFRQQYFYKGYGKLKILISTLSESLQDIVNLAGDEYLESMGVAMLLDAQQKGDEILIADVLEGQLLPCLEQLVQELEQKLPIDDMDFYAININAMKARGWDKLIDIIDHAAKLADCDYIPEYTASGSITIRIVENGLDYYISGNNNPYRDALYFAKGNIEPDRYRYAVLGAGLFFETQALLSQRPDAEVIVVEEDAFLLKLALTYRDMVELLSDSRLTVVCSQYGKFIKETNLCERSIWLRKPALKHMGNHEQRMTLERFFVKSMTIKEQAYVLEKEFRQNTGADRLVKCVDECRDRFAGKTAYLVAGGPSLNPSLDLLKNREEDSIIVCVGTSAGVLQKAGIIPDFIMITDASNDIYLQLKDKVDHRRSTLLYMISANAKAVGYFMGRKYAAFQEGFDMAEDYAREHDYTLVSTGGSVSTTALDICIRMGCKKIVCLGLDLAYTGNRTHAEGTMSNTRTFETTDMPMAKSVSGEMIHTSLNLSCYQNWIERRIEVEKDIEFVNISDGAYIQGMKNVQVEDMRDMILFR